MHSPRDNFGLGSAKTHGARMQDAAGRLDGGFKEAAMNLCIEAARTPQRGCKKFPRRLHGGFKF